MPKRAVPIKRVTIPFDAHLLVQLYKQPYERFHRGILTGQLEPGTRLP